MNNEYESPWQSFTMPAINVPKPVGYWHIDLDKTYFAMFTKPTDEQIRNTEQMFGWKWKDVT